jgi:hypothetical protein
MPLWLVLPLVAIRIVADHREAQGEAGTHVTK